MQTEMKNSVNDLAFEGAKINANDLGVMPHATIRDEPKSSYKPDSDLERANRKQETMESGQFYYE